MEKVFAKAGDLAETIKEYIHNRIAAVKISLADTVSRLIANMAARLIVMVMLFFFLLFGGVAISIVVGNWLGKLWAGFLCTAGIYLLAGLLAWVLRHRLITRPIRNNLIQQLFKDDEDERN